MLQSPKNKKILKLRSLCLNRTLKKTINISFYLLILGFLVFYVQSIDLHELKKIRVVSHGWLITAVGLTILVRILLPFVWTSLLYSFTDKRMDRICLYRIYARSWLCRYIPGKVAWIGTKIAQTLEWGFSKTNLMISSFLEVTIHFFGTMVIGLLFCGLFYDFNDQIKPLLYGAVIVGVLMLLGLNPPIFNRVTRLAYALLKKKELPPKYALNLKMLSKATSLCGVIKLFSGAVVGCLAFGIVDSVKTGHDFFCLVGVASISSVAGMAAVFAPGGLGVNESVQLVLLAGLMSKEEALVITTFWRLIGIGSDLAFWIVIDLIIPRFSCVTKKSTSPTIRK